tara:strand:- start:859 stop:1734 length:876 start_codon:yes stop_codon:yes gene_type:complete
LDAALTLQRSGVQVPSDPFTVINPDRLFFSGLIIIMIVISFSIFILVLLGFILPNVEAITTTTLTFDKTTHQWFRNAQNGNASCEFGNGSGVGSQSPNLKDHGEGWLYYATTTNSGSGCYIPVWDFVVSEIPDNAKIIDVDFIVNISQHDENDGNFTCDFREVDTNISKIFDSTLWNKMTTDPNAKTYVYNDTICTGQKTAYTYDLGEHAINNLQKDLVNDEKFTISIIKTGHTRTVSTIGEGSYDVRFRDAQLVITYEISKFNINTENENILSILQKELFSIWNYLMNLL